MLYHKTMLLFVRVSLFSHCIINRLSRKGLELIYRLFAVPQARFASGVKVNDRPIRYFFGEACHDFSLRERAKGSHTTQRRAGLPVRNRIGENGTSQRKLSKIKFNSSERTPIVLPEMEQLLPPLSAEQFSALESDILENGCYAPIIVSEDMVVIDGHNRLRICEKHDLPFKMLVFSFADLLEAKQGALNT